MNAYELADELEGFNFLDGDIPLAPYQKQADMLREQADRIAELESGIVAIQYTCPNCQTHVELFNKTPQTKPLSDEEMKELINNFPIIFSPQDLLTFARAIEERHGIK